MDAFGRLFESQRTVYFVFLLFTPEKQTDSNAPPLYLREEAIAFSIRRIRDKSVDLQQLSSCLRDRNRSQLAAMR